MILTFSYDWQPVPWKDPTLRSSKAKIKNLQYVKKQP